jgi:hypothetical protein
MKDRSQSINRFLARRELIKKIERLLGQMPPEDMNRDKIRRQKAKRRKRAESKYA